MDVNHKTISFSNEVYEKVLDEIIAKSLKGSADEYEIIYSAGSSKGDNYVGVIYRIEVKKKKNDEIKLNLIAKVPPSSSITRSEFMSNEIFFREADFYDNIYPIYKKFQEERGIDVEKDGFHQVPFCYKTLTEEPNEALFFEDLKASGFEMFDRFKEVTKDHVFLVMKSLAKMHAIFYAINDQNPELIESYLDRRDLFLVLNERDGAPMDTWFVGLKKQALEVINKSDNGDMQMKIKKLLDNKLCDLVGFCFDRKNTEPYATLCHGDCWNNNMMFRNDLNGKPIDLRLLDFQIVRYVSPVCDLMYYIFGCTRKSLRDKHYQDFLNVYYDELSHFMRRLGSDPEKIFPRKAFEEHLKKFGHFGLIMAMMILPFLTSSKEDAPDMEEIATNFKKISESVDVDENAFNFTTEKTYEKYSERLMEVCQDMYELGYI